MDPRVVEDDDGARAHVADDGVPRRHPEALAVVRAVGVHPVDEAGDVEAAERRDALAAQVQPILRNRRLAERRVAEGAPTTKESSPTRSPLGGQATEEPRIAMGTG